MMNRRRLIYLCAWICYLAFAVGLYPELKITVMLYSIPLTMLGGWIYSYKGALLATALTVPLPYILSQIYPQHMIMNLDAINPLGIGTQLFFSLSTAHLKASHYRHQELKNSLEELVKERTRDLEQLTQYLIDIRLLEKQELYLTLLEKPYTQFKAMLGTSALLMDDLGQCAHVRQQDAINVNQLLSSCIKQLQAIENETLPRVQDISSVEKCLQDLAQQIREVSDTTLIYDPNSDWSSIHKTKHRSISEIIYEATTNALKHADPKTITIGVQNADDTTVLFIENDGNPFNDNSQEGMGLPLMNHRATEIGAALSIKTTENHKTRLECELPKES